MLIEKTIEDFSKLKALIIGDVMVDSYIWGKVDRISPEAPVPIVHVQKKEKRLGGAANVALNIQSLGATPILCSVIGNDESGKDLIHVLTKNNLSTNGIVTSSSRITTVKERVIASSQHLVRIDSENDHELNKEEKEKLIAAIKKNIDQIDVIIFEDYDKGVLTAEIIKEIVQLANEKKIPTIVDPKKRNFLNYQQVTLFKPNLKEIKEGLKVEFDTTKLEEIQKVVTQLKNELKIDSVLLTLSEKGVFIDHQKENHFLPAHKREITDVSGAGDTVTAIAALSLALKLPPFILAALSNLGGGLVCEHIGVVPINKKDLIEEAIKNKINLL